MNEGALGPLFLNLKQNLESFAVCGLDSYWFLNLKQNLESFAWSSTKSSGGDPLENLGGGGYLVSICPYRLKPVKTGYDRVGMVSLGCGRTAHANRRIRP